MTGTPPAPEAANPPPEPCNSGVPGAQPVGAALPPARQRHMDQAGVQYLQRRARKAELIEGAGPEAFDQNIGKLHQPLEGGPVRIGLEIEMDNGLASVDQLVTRREAVRVDATQPAHRIASRRLDLDHIGAQIGKDLTGIGAGQILAEIQYPDALQQRLRHTEPLPNLSNPGALSMISSRIASAVSRSLAKPSLNRLT